MNDPGLQGGLWCAVAVLFRWRWWACRETNKRRGIMEFFCFQACALWLQGAGKRSQEHIWLPKKFPAVIRYRSPTFIMILVLAEKK